MASALHISASREFGARRPAVRSKIDRLEERLNALSDDDLETVLDSIAQALERPDTLATSGKTILFTAPVPESQRIEDELELLMRSFERRRELLAGSLTAPQVATLLNTTRQTPHDRVKAGTLLAVMDRGALRFPAWQFNSEGPDGVIAGLPDVIQALVDVSPLAKISWLTRPSEIFDGRSPLDLLKDGQIERVVWQAQGVGVA
ncbi:MAG: antitoxin Xre/MbcA/ParS toxin-binding domain-containing protein [Thermomicrobiales bacterium]